MAHNKTLTELKWFKRALWWPLGVAAVSALVITVCDNYPVLLDWGLTSAHFNDAINRLKFPIAIASLAFPLVALVASHHRSVQTAAQIARTDSQIARTDTQLERTAKQIALTEEKNSFDNNIRHREFFSKQLELLEKRFDIRFRSHFEIYDAIFIANDYHTFQANVDDMSRACRTADSVFTDTENFDEGTFFYDIEKGIEKINSHEQLIRSDDQDSQVSFFEDVLDMLLYKLKVSEVDGEKLSAIRKMIEKHSLDGQFFLPSTRHLLYIVDGVVHNLMVMSFSKDRLMEMDLKGSVFRIESNIYYKVATLRKPHYKWKNGAWVSVGSIFTNSKWNAKKMERWQEIRKRNNT